jgi:hypothetical protein
VVLKALPFYFIIKKLYTDKKINITRPFSLELRRLILTLSYLALGIGLFSHFGFKYCMWLTSHGLEVKREMKLNVRGTFFC